MAIQEHDRGGNAWTHVKVTAGLHLALGALLLLCGLVVGLLVALAGGVAGAAGAPGWIAWILGGVGLVVVLLLALLGAPLLAAGWGLLRLREWARILAFILSVPFLLAFPLGTAFAVYTYWALARADAGALFRPPVP